MNVSVLTRKLGSLGLERRVESGRNPEAVKSEPLSGCCPSDAVLIDLLRRSRAAEHSALQHFSGAKRRKFAYRLLSVTAFPHRSAPAAGNRAGGQAIEGSRAARFRPFVLPPAALGAAPSSSSIPPPNSPILPTTHSTHTFPRTRHRQRALVARLH